MPDDEVKEEAEEEEEMGSGSEAAEGSEDGGSSPSAIRNTCSETSKDRLGSEGSNEDEMEGFDDVEEEIEEEIEEEEEEEGGSEKETFEDVGDGFAESEAGDGEDDDNTPGLTLSRPACFE